MRSTRKKLLPNEVNIPFLPSQIDLDEVVKINVATNEVLLTTEEKAADIIQALKDAPDGRYSKTCAQLRSLNLKNGVIKLNNQHYLIGKGSRHGKKYGNGSYGLIKFCKNIVTGKLAALKILSSMNSIEVANLQQLGLLYGAFERKESVRNFSQYCILMQFEPGENLETIIYKKPNLPLLRLLLIAKNICKALAKLHEEHRMLHRDLKCTNIMLNYISSSIAIIDFGLSTVLPANTHSIQDFAKPGAPFARAPEATRLGQYSKASDSYSLGITLGELFQFLNEDLKLMDAKIACSKHYASYEKETYLKVHDYLDQQLLHERPNMRPTAAQAEKFFAVCIEEQLKKGLPFSIGVLDVAAYLNFDLHERKFAHACLENFDQIIFSDTCKRELTTYIKLQSGLEKLNINALNIVFINNTLNALIRAQEVAAPNLCNEFPTHCKYFYVSFAKLISEEQKKLLSTHSITPVFIARKDRHEYGEEILAHLQKEVSIAEKAISSGLSTFRRLSIFEEMKRKRSSGEKIEEHAVTQPSVVLTSSAELQSKVRRR